MFQHADSHHVWVNTICLAGALLGYNALSVVRRHLGAGGLLRLFRTPLSEAGKLNPPGETPPTTAGE